MQDLGSDAVTDFDSYELGDARRHARSMRWSGMLESLIQHLPSVRSCTSNTIAPSDMSLLADIACDIVYPRSYRHPTSSECIHFDDPCGGGDPQLDRGHGL